MLTLDRVSLTQGDFTLSADFELENGGVVAVIGPSGGGKSTFLSLIAGFDTPDQGRILWSGDDLTHKPPGARPVAMLFQDNNLFPHLSVMENVCLGLAPTARPSPQVIERAREALAQVGLEGYGSRKPAALSGGQQSRAALARVLLTHKPLVLMDEPFSALGPGLKKEMLDLVTDVLNDATVLMVTHDPDDALRIAARTILIAEGDVSPPADTRALFDNPPEALAAYIS